MTPPRARLAAALCLAALASIGCGSAEYVGEPAAAAAPAPGYAIQMHRRQKPGDRGMVSTVVRSNRSMVIEENGQVMKRDEQNETVEFKARVRVIRVDAKGSPVELEYSIQGLSVEHGDGEKKTFPPGRVVVADRSGKKVLFRATPDLSDEEEKALSEIVSGHTSDTTDDDVFGTPDRQAPGASWPVNSVLMAKELADTGLHLGADAVSGQVRLVGVAKVSGKDCLELAGEFTVRDAWPTDIPGARPEKGEIRSTYRALLPIDVSAPEIESALTVDIDLVMMMPVPPDREARATMISRKSTRRRFTPLP